MNHKAKRLECAPQYQSMNAKEWRRAVFSDKTNSIYTVQMDFRSSDTQKNFQ